MKVYSVISYVVKYSGEEYEKLASQKTQIRIMDPIHFSQALQVSDNEGDNMINSHFVPQFLLRNFCSDSKIQYYNKNTKTVESRSTRSVFSEKGYYPDQLEKDLCNKIEYQFSVVLNNKLLKARDKITLNSDEMWILKKYLIITMLRVHDDNMEHNTMYRFLKRDGFIQDPDEFEVKYSGDFYDNIIKILNCPDPYSALELTNTEANITLFSFIRDVINSYNVFVRSNRSKEDFVITDRGWANYCGIISVKKLNAILDTPVYQFDPFLQQVIRMSSPQDYAVYPLSSNLAIITVSPAVQVMLPGSPYKIILPPEAPTLAKCMGFGNNRIFTAPKKQLICGMKLYTYEVHQLKQSDVAFLNCLLIDNADAFIGFADQSKIRYSFDQSGLSISY